MIVINNCNDSTIIIYNHNDNGHLHKTMILANVTLPYRSINWSLQTEAYLIVVFYKCNFFIEQATGAKVIILFTAVMYEFS